MSMENDLTVMKYTVWVGGSVIGEYESANEAQEVADDWILDGYDDTKVERKEED